MKTTGMVAVAALAAKAVLALEIAGVFEVLAKSAFKIKRLL
jgi:hypothetical protein